MVTKSFLLKGETLLVVVGAMGERGAVEAVAWGWVAGGVSGRVAVVGVEMEEVGEGMGFVVEVGARVGMVVVVCWLYW